MRGGTLVTFALPQEGYPFVRKLKRRAVRRGLVLGHLGTREIAVCWVGIGVKNIDLFASAVSELQPHLIIHSGFAGGIRSLLESGDFVLATNYSSPEILGRVRGSDLFSAIGKLASVSAIAGPETKARLRLEGDILAVDMESEKAAAVCRKISVPFLTARMISDRSDEAVPRMFAGGKLRGADDVFHAIRFAGRMLVLRERLATRLSQLIEELEG
jgi:nucleoside phosphorylase